MVFDYTVRGINEALCCPNLILPVVFILLMMVGIDTHMVDLNVVYIFYKFRLS